jgi:hypothetical protein
MPAGAWPAAAGTGRRRWHPLAVAGALVAASFVVFGAVLSGAVLSGAVLSGSVLSGSVLSGAVLSGGGVAPPATWVRPSAWVLLGAAAGFATSGST